MYCCMVCVLVSVFVHVCYYVHVHVCVVSEGLYDVVWFVFVSCVCIICRCM